MKIVLTRHPHPHKEAIDGRLTIDGIYICDTAERASTCLKPGSYRITIAQCQRLERKMPLLQGCSGDCAACSFLNAGNGVYNLTNGSILVGETICPGCVKHSRKAFNALYQRLRKSAKRGNELLFIIQ